MDESTMCSNNGILTRNQRKMLNEKNADKQTTPSDKKKIKIKENLKPYFNYYKKIFKKI